ncbi:MAG: DUF2510 domain-containing protein [Acidimicrobiales bacterium]
MTGAADPADDQRGWHADPFGRHRQRWWDGTRWTERVRSGDVMGIDPPGIDPTPAAPGVADPVGPLDPKPPVELRSLKVPQGLLLGMVLLILIVTLVIVGLVS